ncbi:type II toxin-antitoxin system VapC family toxin [Gandjariella thermophila]|uniref:Ribonuclease VapC n=1 Tax=Gandjariella thermophila TaxID=1931992 RepID=A0A4D4J7G5_9PSEU|nr:PIN domain-containing protein [Gandjariella thermophila]GDY32601.1 hypothetical protein GTS_42340 [Gandjariella thermophila]
MIVLDASVLIAHFDAMDAHHEQATTLLRAAVRESFGASIVTLAEVLVGPHRAGRSDEVVSILHRLGVSAVEMGVRSAPRLAALRATTNLKMPDCCVLLAAEESRASIATFDDRLAKAAAQRGIVVEGAH